MPTGKYIVTERKPSLRRRMKGTRKLSNSKGKYRKIISLENYQLFNA